MLDLSRTPEGTSPELFAPDATWMKTQVLDARAVGTRDFDLDEFARYRRIRILTYSSSVPMLATLFERFPDATVECVFGYARTVTDMAALIALQTVAMEDVGKALRGLSAPRREEVLRRVQEGGLHLRVVEGHVSHAKIFLLSDGPDGARCAVTGSANFSTQALLGDQHEVMIRFDDDLAWDHFEAQYLGVRDHASAALPVSRLAEDLLDPAGTVSPDAAPVLDPGRGTRLIQVAQPAEADSSLERGRRVEKLCDVILPAVRTKKAKSESSTIKLDGTRCKQFSGLIRRQLQGREEASHPTFTLDPVRGEATVCGTSWPLESAEEKVRGDVGALVSFWDTYGEVFRGRVDKLQRDYFIFLCWMFFSPLVCTLRRRAALEGRDIVRYPRVGLVYGKSNSGKTQLVDIVGKFMLGDDFQGAIRTRLTGSVLRGIDEAYRRMPAFFDDVGARRFREHATEFIKDETLSPHEETPCIAVSMNARAGGFPDEIAKRCLLIYSSASLPSEDEGGRIAMSDRLSSMETTTHLYRRYLRDVLDRLEAGEDDWLLLSSKVLSGILAECGYEPDWARPITWAEYASTRHDALREQLGSLLDVARRHATRPPPDTEGWYAEAGKVWVRVGTNTFGHPDFEWRDLPTYMLHEHESRASEFVLDLKAVENFLGRKLAVPRWRLPFRLRASR